jgi:hypothetical protein
MRSPISSLLAVGVWISVAAGQQAGDSASLRDSVAAVGADSSRTRPAATDTAREALAVPRTYGDDQARPFSLFDYRNIVSAGISLSWLYYAEDPNLSDLIEYYGAIVGTPKSTEYGTVITLGLGETFYNWRNRLVVRPKLSLLVGFDNTYDGSDQGQQELDDQGHTLDIRFTPEKFQKTNIFLFGECDLGYAFPNPAWPLFVYSGLDGKLWYRNLLPSENVLVSSAGYSYEFYYWFSVPLGVNITRPLDPRWIMGADASVNFMVYGGMQVGQANGGTTASYPPVTLGNRASAKVEIFVEKKRDNKPALRFAPYFLYYGFGQSNSAVAQTTDGTSQLFYEPSSNSFLFGATLSWEFLGRRAN